MPVASPPALAATDLRRLVENIERVIFGKTEVIRLAVVALLAEGHLLLEDVPGTGKTTLARALSASIDLDFSRIQFTSDLLPADVIGLSLPEAETGRFKLQKGPIFASVVLADELNRTPPRTQSALLECMSERSVSLEGETHLLPRPFLVVATQNPLEFEGTYALPESQLDRFLLRLRLGYPDRSAERRVLRNLSGVRAVDKLEVVLSRTRLLELIDMAQDVRVSDEILDYLQDVIDATRRGDCFLLGASPRAALGLYRAAQARALLDGRDYCVPDDIKELALPTLAHRIVPNPLNGTGGRSSAQVLAELLAEIVVPE